MKRLETFASNRQTAAQELEEFRDLLSSKSELYERQDILPFFRHHKQLIALLGCLHEVLAVDRIGSEFDLFGDFIADFVAGSTDQNSYCFIEFQDAVPSSVFVRVNRANSEWAPSFEEAFSQIIDWSCKLSDNARTNEFCNRFGAGEVETSFVIVLGRDSFLDTSERNRLRWRRRHIALQSKPIRCLTYDEFLNRFDIVIHKLFGAAQTDLV